MSDQPVLSDQPVVKPPRQRQPTTERGRATRQAILDAAEEVFGELSYERASVSEITRRAGVAQGTFYVYFPDKQAAFVELVHHLNHDLRVAIRTAITGIDDRVEAERVGFRTFFQYMSRHRALNRIVRESEFVAPETYRWHRRRFAEGYIARLEEAQRKGQITADISAENMSWVLLGIAEFAGSHWVISEDHPPSPEVFDDIMKFITRAISPGGEL